MFEVTGLRRAYPDGSRELVVLDDVSFKLEPGDFAGLYGKRRSGKSTLLRIAAGIEPPDSGSVRVEGRDLASMSPNKRAEFLRERVALAHSFFGGSERNRLVSERVGMALRIDGDTTGRQATRQAHESLREMGVQDCYNAPLCRLSLGERIRVELARALVRRPQVLLVDDPPPLQSPSEGSDLYELLRSIGEESGRTVVLASSELDLAQQAHRLMRLSQGDLRVMDRQATVFEFPVPRSGTERA